MRTRTRQQITSFLKESNYSPSDLQNGPTSVHSLLRLFGSNKQDVRVTLFRDHHAWCPYCEKTAIWLEEKKIPYHISKITMRCYGNPQDYGPARKEKWFLKIVPSGMLPVIALDGKIYTESDKIIQILEDTFGSINNQPLQSKEVQKNRRLERNLFGVWCQWLCQPNQSTQEEQLCKTQFVLMIKEVEKSLQSTEGCFFLKDFGPCDIVFLPFLERMNASLYYYKGYDLRKEHQKINEWFQGWENRSTYRGFVSDFSTHCHDLPPQMGNCYSNKSKETQICQDNVDFGPFINESLQSEVCNKSYPEPNGSKLEACYRVMKHWDTLANINPFGKKSFEIGMPVVMSYLIDGNLNKFESEEKQFNNEDVVLALIYIRDRISVPRDMSIWAGKRFRDALDKVAKYNLDIDDQDYKLSGIKLNKAKYQNFDLKNQEILYQRFDQSPVPFIGNPISFKLPSHLQ